MAATEAQPAPAAVSARAARVRAWVGGTLVAAVAAWQLHHLLLWTPARLTIHGLLADDAFFYSVLARNFTRFGFLTLDGEMPTNGVQPLWMALQMLLVGIFPGVHEVRLLAISSWLIYALVCMLTVGYLVRAHRQGVFVALIVAGLVLLNPRFQAWVVQGLETPLCLLWFILLCYALKGTAAFCRTAPRQLRSSRALVLGLLAALCFLTRTDHFWVPAILALWLFLGRRVDRRGAAAYLVPLALLALPYLGYNLFAHGGLMPISGRVKLFYLHSFFDSGLQYLTSDAWWAIFHAFSDPSPFPIPYPVPWTLILLGAAFFLVWKVRRSDAAFFPLRLLALAMLGHLLTLSVFYRELMTRNAYYFAPTLLWAVLVYALWLADPRPAGTDRERLRPSWRRPRAWLAPLAAAGALLIAFTAWQQRDLAVEPYWLKRMQLAEDIRRMVPPHERVAAFWPGVFAQFCGREVTPLDGVIGSREYFRDYVRPGRELDYILERTRPYLAVHLPMYPDSLLAEEAPPIPSWTRIGVRRIWERRDALRYHVLSARRVAKGEGGWCLLAVEPRMPVAIQPPRAASPAPEPSSKP
ncbi:MAG: hypothetical protein KAY32_13395 [Candidatus Eisenbacteria sp.]|nr:hypothetical protein [Candidatus Eisenbacteria bacterium]